MKDFVLAVHARAGEVGGAGGLTKRAQMLLELVVDSILLLLLHG